MKRLMRVFCAIFLLLFFGQIIAGEMRYVDKKNNFSIKVPTKWSKTTKKKHIVKDSIYTIRRGAAAISVSTFNNKNMIDVVAKSMAQPFIKAKAKRVISEDVAFHGAPGHIDKWTLGKEIIYIGVGLGGSSGYIISGIMPKKTSKTIKQELKTILYDFEIIEDCPMADEANFQDPDMKETVPQVKTTKKPPPSISKTIPEEIDNF